MLKPLRALAGALALVCAVTLLPALAHATSIVRVEFIQRGNGSPAPPAVFYSAQRLTVTGSTPVASNAAPAYNNDGVARVTVISGAVVVAWGASPTGGEANGVRMQVGDQRDIFLPPGQSLSFVEAADGPSSGAAAPYMYSPTGFVPVASFSTSTGFTPPTGSTVCFIQAEGNSVRFRTDGVAPTASVGQLFPTNVLMQLTAGLSTFRAIPTSGSATLDVDCYK